jgi:hypothetical protein
MIASFFARSFPRFLYKLSIYLILLFDLLSESLGQQPPAKFTEADAFETIYLTSGNFDYCGQRAVGQKLRRLLEIEYGACFSSSDKQNIDLPYLKDQIQQLDHYLDEGDLAPMKGGDLEDCSKFLLQPNEKGIAAHIFNIKAKSLLASLPKNCNNYQWMSD